MSSSRPDWQKWLVVVPARLQSTRLPEKPLADLAGKPLLVRVLENLAPLQKAGAKLRVATDATKIVEACQKANFDAVLTKDTHVSGTDRCHEASQGTDRPYVLNVQCDEPFLDLGDLEALAAAVEQNTAADIGTLVYRSQDRARFILPQAVKAVADGKMRALYFSRAAIPVDRDGTGDDLEWLQHVGIYAFRKEALARFCALPEGRLERLERLEQLRALENGMIIQLVEARHLPLGIDTPSDLEEAHARF